MNGVIIFLSLLLAGDFIDKGTGTQISTEDMLSTVLLVAIYGTTIVLLLLSHWFGKVKHPK